MHLYIRKKRKSGDGSKMIKNVFYNLFTNLGGCENARVGNEVTEGIVGQYGVPGRNENGERLLEMCAKQELVVDNSWFKKMMCINTRH